MSGTRILLCALALATSGFATCGGEQVEDEASVESPGQAATDEMMQDAIRDSDR